MCRGTSYGQPGAGYSVAARYSAEESNAYGIKPRKKVIMFLGCTCGGNSPCRGTCRTLFTE